MYEYYVEHLYYEHEILILIHTKKNNKNKNKIRYSKFFIIQKKRIKIILLFFFLYKEWVKSTAFGPLKGPISVEFTKYIFSIQISNKNWKKSQKWKNEKKKNGFDEFQFFIKKKKKK